MKKEKEEIQYNEEWLKAYKVGALLYSPATNEKIADYVLKERYGKQYSLALCLEDSISDCSVKDGEDTLIHSLKKIYNEQKKRKFYLPMIFIRVRRPEQMIELCRRLEESIMVLTGFIFPKFSVACSKKYLDCFMEAVELSGKKLYMMPIIESQDVIDLKSRYETLETIRETLDSVKEYVLNVRVGGNDFCKEFGIRRQVKQPIYEIGCVANILYDVAACFARNYVVSGPVWEYFDGINEEWKTGMIREIGLDRLNGFIGKTMIHPKQIPVYNLAMKVDKRDYLDALGILGMSESTEKLVKKSASGERMNEYKTHLKWAEKTLILAEIYGVEECRNEKKVIQR